MDRILEIDVHDFFNSQSSIWVEDRLAERGLHVMFRNNYWWYRKGACNVFKTHASTSCGLISLAIGPGTNDPTVTINRKYISHLSRLSLNNVYNSIDHAQMKDCDVLAIHDTIISIV